MKMTLSSTTKIVELNGVPARIWEGQTEKGIPIHAFVTRVAVHKDDDAAELEKELQEHTAPRNADIAAYPARMVI